jgi:hypothetical protein
MPHVTMDRIADLGQGFFGGTGHAHVIAFFSPVNLKGGLISIGIGLVLYAAVIRQFLMRPETGAVGTEAEASGGDKKAGVRGRCYVNRWPSWLDLENLVYRPVLQVFMAVASVVCRALDHMTDGAVVLLRKTVYRQLPEPKAHLEGNWLAHLLGGIVDGFGLLWEKVSGKSGDGQVRVSAVHHFIEREKQMKHMGMLVEQSFSFGLILFCIGLCLTLGYLLFVFIR